MYKPISSNLPIVTGYTYSRIESICFLCVQEKKMIKNFFRIIFPSSKIWCQPNSYKMRRRKKSTLLLFFHFILASQTRSYHLNYFKRKNEWSQSLVSPSNSPKTCKHIHKSNERRDNLISRNDNGRGRNKYLAQGDWSCFTSLVTTTGRDWKLWEFQFLTTGFEFRKSFVVFRFPSKSEAMATFSGREIAAAAVVGNSPATAKVDFCSWHRQMDVKTVG